MTIISTDQLVDLQGTEYTVRTGCGEVIGTYYQFRGEDTVTSADLPTDDNGIIGPIEAIAAFASAAGLEEYTLSDKPGHVTTADDLKTEIHRRIDAKGGYYAVTVEDLLVWANDLGMLPHQLCVALVQLQEEQPVAA